MTDDSFQKSDFQPGFRRKEKVLNILIYYIYNIYIIYIIYYCHSHFSHSHFQKLSSVICHLSDRKISMPKAILPFNTHFHLYAKNIIPWLSALKYDFLKKRQKKDFGAPPIFGYITRSDYLCRHKREPMLCEACNNPINRKNLCA